MNYKNIRICVVGLGYVGLPLAVEFGKKFIVVGFDIDKTRIQELRSGFDKTQEINNEEINKSNNLSFTADVLKISDCNVFIITVPTPVDEYKKPDLKPLLKATEMIGAVLKKGDFVIFESTVYPGCTEEQCVPILEKQSGLKYNSEFYCGYSPERINPGDKINTLINIKKVTSGSTHTAANFVDNLYKEIILAGTYKASSIKVAEASKAIENAQRDINISFVNELALIFDRIGIDTNDVIEAASTKWNFLKFKPGLVGGHCIGVDPYYLAFKAETLGYYPQVILSGRRVNDNMGVYIANRVVKLMMRKGLLVNGASVIILGTTFKENCPDIRNSKVIDIYNEFLEFGMKVTLYDPLAESKDVKKSYGVKSVKLLPKKKFDAIVLAVAHNEFLNLDIANLKRNKKSVVFDSKSCLPKNLVDARL